MEGEVVLIFDSQSGDGESLSIEGSLFKSFLAKQSSFSWMTITKTQVGEPLDKTQIFSKIAL